MQETIIGIDLGTTNSEVAVVQDNRPIIIGAEIIPSVVGIGADGETLIGTAARNQYVLYPERTVKSIKREMGRDIKITMAEEQYRPQEISAIILKHLKNIAEDYLGFAVSKAVITVPAFFNDAQRQATREAGELAGLEVVRIINEPTAAALAYETEHHGQCQVLVYDLGGGTFDVSVVRMEDDVVEVVSSHGNNHLGGDDFDQRIVEHMVEHLKQQFGPELNLSHRVMARINQAAERAKCTLSDHPFAKIEEEYLLENNQGPVHLRMELTREHYQEMIEPYVKETLEAIHIALQGASLTVADIDQILLVGGSTRTPLIRSRLQAEFRRQPRGELDPDLCVAMGAAIQGAMIGGDAVSAVLVDVTPYTFGTSAIGEVDGAPTLDKYVPVIHKNSPIPVTKSEIFYTAVDSQEKVNIDIYQGEEPLATDNVEIGNFMVTGLSKVPEGNAVVIQLALDLDGLLKVTAVEKSSGLTKSITIDNAMSRFEKDELKAAKQRVEELFDDSHGSVTTEQHRIVQARALVEKAERMLETTDADDREDLVDLIEAINDAIERGDSAAVHEQMEALSDIIYYLAVEV